MAAQLAVGYRHLLGVHMPKQCQKALLYYNPVAEKVVAGAQRVKASQLIEKARLPTADSRSPHTLATPPCYTTWPHTLAPPLATHP